MAEEEFWRMGHSLSGHDFTRNCHTGHRIFREFFGTSPSICSVVWREFESIDAIPKSAQPQHLLWALLFLKRYLTEHVMSSIICCDEKTIRKWVWTFVRLLSSKLTIVISIDICTTVIFYFRLTGNLDSYALGLVNGRLYPSMEQISELMSLRLSTENGILINSMVQGLGTKLD